MKLIKRGAKGHGVAVIQHMLRRVGYRSIKIDEDFGPKTKAAVKRFQRKYRLSVDGIVGPRTLRRLKSAFRLAIRRKRKANKARKVKSYPIKKKVRDYLPKRKRPGVPAIPRVRRRINKIVIHYTASPDVSMKTIAYWHRKRGFNGPGYHFGVRRNGNIEVGRSLARIGAHVKGHNTGTIGIVLPGSNLMKWYPAKAQIVGLKLLIAAIKVVYRVKTVEHRMLASTACPGKFKLSSIR